MTNKNECLLYLKVSSHQLASEHFQKLVYCMKQRKYVTYLHNNIIMQKLFNKISLGNISIKNLNIDV